MKKIILCLVLVTVPSCCRFLQNDKTLRVMSYNVQNLFDDISSGSEYDEFDPANGTWTSKLYHLKLCAIADVIACEEAGGPDIILLQEIENERAVSDLADGYLKSKSYKYYFVSQEDFGSIHTAVISRFPILSARAHRIWGKDFSDQRFIMQYRIDFYGKDLFVFNNHWKSKSGNSGETERAAAAAALGAAISKLSSKYDSPLIIAGGDFNSSLAEETPFAKTPLGDSSGFIVELGPGPIATSETANLVFYKPDNGMGSYVYRDEWEAIDMLMVSKGVADNFNTRLFYVNPDFLLNSRGYPSAFSSISAEGYSDHLPLCMELESF